MRYNFALYNNNKVIVARAPDDLFRGNFTVKTHLLCVCECIQKKWIPFRRVNAARHNEKKSAHAQVHFIHFSHTPLRAVEKKRCTFVKCENTRRHCEIAERVEYAPDRMIRIENKKQANIYRWRIFIWHEISLFYNKAINASLGQTHKSHALIVCIVCLPCISECKQMLQRARAKKNERWEKE